MCDNNHQYYILCSFSNELRPLQPLGYQNVGAGIAFEGREMANKTNEVLLHMQTLSDKIKLFTKLSKVSYKSADIFIDGFVFEVYEGSLSGYTSNYHIIYLTLCWRQYPPHTS